MKKLFTLLFIAGAMSIVSCGGNAEDEAAAKAKEKAKMDSIFNAASMGANAAKDSMAVAKPDSAKAAEPAATEEKK